MHGRYEFLISEVQFALSRTFKDQLDGICWGLFPAVPLRGFGNVLPDDSSVDTLEPNVGIQQLVGPQMRTVIRLGLLRIKIEFKRGVIRTGDCCAHLVWGDVMTHSQKVKLVDPVVILGLVPCPGSMDQLVHLLVG